jgi:tetratricopeptide (TPR) repeat protein
MRVGAMKKTGGRPYPGTRAFRRTDRDLFFGRGDETAALAEWWQNNKLTFAVGDAGRGKTSLLNAGILPRLADANVTVLPVGRLSASVAFPAAALPGQNPYTLALLSSWAPDEVVSRLAGRTVPEFIERQRSRTVLAAIDQADELLADTSARRAHLRRFLDELSEALQVGGLHLLIAAREDAADVIASRLGGGIRYDIGALAWQGAVDAVRKPAFAAGRSFAQGAAEKLVTDLQTSRLVADDGTERPVTAENIEPALLQVVCARLWDSLPGQDVITVRDIRGYADVDAVLAAHCGTVISRVADDHDISAQRLGSWLLSTFVTERGSRDKAREGATTAGMPNTLVRALEDHHVLTGRQESGSRWYKLLSDRLIEPLRMAAAVRMPSPGPDEYVCAAGHALTLGELDLAERYAKEVLKTPLQAGVRMHAEANSLLGNIAYEREKPEEAEGRYRAAARLFGVAGDNRALADQLAAVGQTLIAQGHVKEAVDELDVAVRRMPSDLNIKTQLALALWQCGEAQAAVAFLTDVLRVDGGNRTALQARGEILAYLGDARRAMLDLDRVTLHAQPSTRAARGLALAELGDQRGAREEIEAAVADEGQWNGPALLYAARALQTGGDSRAAEEYARKAANATDPPLSPQYLEVARRLAGRGHG